MDGGLNLSEDIINVHVCEITKYTNLKSSINIFTKLV